MDYARLGILVGWFGILAGVVAGTIQGLFFHKDNWLGGYSSWRRRMVRLAHISFFGIGFINLSFGLTINALDIQKSILIPLYLFIIGEITMPIVCYLAAIKKLFRHLFFIPVLSVLIATLVFVLGGILK